LNNKDNFKVIVRVRPPIARELSKYGSLYQDNIEIDSNNKSLTIFELVYTDLENENSKPAVYSKTQFT